MSETAIEPNVPRTFGALLIGALFATLLTGYYHAQGVTYFHMYPSDSFRLKALVIIVWSLDTLHTACIWSALWTYLIGNYGNALAIDIIHWDLAFSIVITALLTVCVHFFFAQRIFMLSKRNWWLVAPIVIIAVLRLISASAATGEMLHHRTFSRFKDEIEWLFWIGLAFSSAVDVIITASLFWLLHSSKTGVGSINAIINSIILYTFETCSLTTASTVAAMICWLTMPRNMVFMGMHFVIAKLYANSFIITLNTRDVIRKARWQGTSTERTTVPVHFLGSTKSAKGVPEFDGIDEPSTPNLRHSGAKESKTPALEINVEQTVQYD